MFKWLLELISLRSLWQSAAKSVENMENVFSPNSGSQRSVIKGSAGLASFHTAWERICYMLFFYILLAAWQSLASLGLWYIIFISSPPSLHVFFFPPRHLLPELFSYKNTSHWLGDLSFTSWWPYRNTSFQFLSSCFQIRIQSQVLGVRIWIYLTALLLRYYWHLI